MSNYYDSEYQWIWDNMVERNRKAANAELLKRTKEQLADTQRTLNEGHDFGALTEVLLEQEKELINMIGELGGWDDKD